MTVLLLLNAIQVLLLLVKLRSQKGEDHEVSTPYVTF